MEGTFPTLSEENTPLHVAAAKGSVNEVKSLIKSGSDIEAVNILGWTPLMQAARYGCKDVVAILLKNQVGINSRNKFGLNALVLAVASGSVETVRLLIDNGASYNYKLDLLQCQVSPLMVAALFANDIVLRLLLDKGMNANIVAPESDVSSLMVAASSSCQSTLKMLIERGAKTNFINAGEFSAIDVAEYCNNKEIVEYLKGCALTLVKKKDDTNCNIMEVIRQGDFSLLQNILLCDSSKARTVTPEGATPLMMAAVMNHIPMAELLLQYGADINAKDNENGWTPLMQATYHRHTSMAKHLMKWGADVAIKANQGYTVFDLANEVMDTDILNVFAAHEAKNNNLMSSNSVLYGNVGDTKAELETASTLQSVKLLLNRFVKKVSPSNLETIPKKPGNEKRRSLTPLTVTYQSIYPDVPKQDNLFYTNVFASMAKVEEDFLDGMQPPSFENADRKTDRKEMPAGLTERPTNGCYSNDLLVRKYRKKENISRNGTQSKRQQKIPEILVSDPPETPTHVQLRHQYGAATTTEGGGSNEIAFSGYDNLSDILRRCQLRSRAKFFEDEQVDSEAFMMLNAEDYRDLGISGTQRIENIIKARNELNVRRKN